MTDEQRKQRAHDLLALLESPGGRILLNHIEEEIADGWNSFIALPVAQKTNKAAFNHQARYDVLKNLKEWIYSEISVTGISAT
jgi:hypothetical protein